MKMLKGARGENQGVENYSQPTQLNQHAATKIIMVHGKISLNGKKHTKYTVTTTMQNIYLYGQRQEDDCVR